MVSIFHCGTSASIVWAAAGSFCLRNNSSLATLRFFSVFARCWYTPNKVGSIFVFLGLTSASLKRFGRFSRSGSVEFGELKSPFKEKPGELVELKT